MAGALCMLSCPHNSLLSADVRYTELLGQCRGIVLEKSTGKAVCVPFYKFWNLGEKYADEIDWSTAATISDACMLLSQVLLCTNLRSLIVENGGAIVTSQARNSLESHLPRNTPKQ
eukprot:3414114-Amphidinium_carterae.1